MRSNSRMRYHAGASAEVAKTIAGKPSPAGAASRPSSGAPSGPGKRIAAACAEYPCGRTGNRQGRSSCRAEFALRCRTGALPGSPATSISACRHRRNRFIARPNRDSAVDVDGADVEEIAAAEIEERFLVEMEFGAFLAHPALGEHEQLGHVDPAVVLKIGLAVEPLQ